MSFSSPSRQALPSPEILSDLLVELQASDFPLELPGDTDIAQLRKNLIAQLQARILPLVRRQDLPQVMVVAGPSGVGKSTLVNSLIGRELSPAGVLRPTTRHPIAVVHPKNERQLDGHLLAELCQIRCDEHAIEGLVVIDAPDLDSVLEHNREVSRQLQQVADLWVFVTSATRYGDSGSWNLLVESKQDGATIAVVLDRVPKAALAKVRSDLLQRMNAAGLGDAPFFAIEDRGAMRGMLPEEAVREVRSWLEMVGRTQGSQLVAQRTLKGTWPALRRDVLTLADALDAQCDTQKRLLDVTDEAARMAAEKVARLIAEGRTGAGAPTGRWLSVAAGGGALSSLVSGRGRLKRAMRRASGDNDRTAAAQLVGRDADQAISVILREACSQARAAVEDAWPLTGILNIDADTLDAIPHVEDQAVSRAIEAWNQRTAELVAGNFADDAGASPAWKMCSAPGWSALLRAAAIGVSGVRNAVSKYYPAAARALNECETILREECDQAIAATLAPLRALVDDLELRSGTRLRVRASELRSL